MVSPETNKAILDQGVKVAVDDICLPFKVFYGHILYLTDKVDFLFVPRFISLGRNNCVCPKFMGLPDMLKATIDNLPELLEPEINFRKGIFPMRRTITYLGKKLKIGFFKREMALRKAIKQQEFYQEQIKKTGFNSQKINIALLGHNYLTNDKYLGGVIITHLKQMKVEVVTTENFDPMLLENSAEKQPKKLFWLFNRRIMGSAYYLFNKSREIDGIIQLTAFGCGPDSMIKELIDLKGKKSGIPILNINLDEHSGQAGLITRLEAFVDLLERRVGA